MIRSGEVRLSRGGIETSQTGSFSPAHALCGDHWNQDAFLRWRDCKREGRAYPEFGFHPNLASQVFNDLFADRQTETRTCDRLAGATDERCEHSRLVLQGNAHAIIRDSDDPLWPAPLRGHVNMNRFFAGILNRVPNQILKETYQLPLMPKYSGQTTYLDYSAAFLDGLS